MEHERVKSLVADINKRMIHKAEADWNMTYGDITPRSDQFGRTVILPAFFANEWGKWFAEMKVDEFGEEYLDATWNREYRKTGLRVIFKGRDKGRLPKGFRVAFVGLGFTRPLIMSSFRLEIPYDNVVEEGEVKRPKEWPLTHYFRKGYEIDEQTQFRLLGTITAKGKQRVIPLGFSIFKMP